MMSLKISAARYTELLFVTTTFCRAVSPSFKKALSELLTLDTDEESTSVCTTLLFCSPLCVDWSGKT